MPKTVALVILSTILLGTFIPVYAKSMPSAKPDVSLDISIIEEGQPQLEDGMAVHGGRYMTEEKLQLFYNDLGKVDRIFGTIIIPVINDFVEVHRKQIANKYTDSIRISYSPQTNAIVIIFLQSPEDFSKTIEIEPQFSYRLQITDMVNVQFPVSMRFGDETTYDDWLRYILPNTSARVGYLTNYMQKMIAKHENEVIDKIFFGISSFMIADMSKTRMYIDHYPITEYNTGIKLVLPNPISVYELSQFFTNTPLSVVKSADKPASIWCSSPDTDIESMMLTYPDGEKKDISSKLMHEQLGVKGVEYTLQGDEPEGLYEILVSDTEPQKTIYCSTNVNIENYHRNDPPLKQLEKGVAPRDVICRDISTLSLETMVNVQHVCNL